MNQFTQDLMMNMEQSSSRTLGCRFPKGGFTLTEVMVVITIIAIITGIAIPNFLTWLANARLRDAAQDLVSDFQFAKSEAIRRNKNVVLRPDTKVCVPGIPSPGGGYAIFADDGSGGGVARDNIQNGTEPLLKQINMPQGAAVCANSFATGYTGYTPNGRPIGLLGGTVTMQNDKGRTRVVTLSIAGGVSLD
ncbi:MAG: GspH/FimT family pseudopilin [Desulforhopalus sp.]|nr:GspH/FimT family pseudopilin [Desulforhopalus sp.]